MKIKINSQFDIDSQDVTNLTFKLTRISEKNARSGVAFFSSIKYIKQFLTNNYPELVTDKIEELSKTNDEFYTMLNKNGISGKHDIKFYIDDFYYVSFDRDTYVLYVHSNLNGNPDPNSDNHNKKPVPNKDRYKIVCYPSSISSAIEMYYNQMLRNSELEGDEFIKYIPELIKHLETKLKELKESILQPQV
ncbi:hypothetical protein CCP1ISM_90005 [Azospirillaceae bacterium]